MEDKVCMAAWAVKHRDFVKKLTIDQGVSRELVVLSVLVRESLGLLAVSRLFSLAIHSALTQALLCDNSAAVTGIGAMADCR